jgi:hypothetical protein
MSTNEQQRTWVTTAFNVEVRKALIGSVIRDRTTGLFSALQDQQRTLIHLARLSSLELIQLAWLYVLFG